MVARDDQIAALRAVIAENEAAMEHMRQYIETLRRRLAPQQPLSTTVQHPIQIEKKPQQQQQLL
jgi:hypothetical protein